MGRIPPKRFLARRFALGAAGVFLLAGVGSAQESGNPREEGGHLALLSVRVRQADGTPAMNLRLEDFRVYEDEREVPIALFEDAAAPAHVALVIDTSASRGRDLELLKEGAVRFLEKFDAEDHFAVYRVGPKSKHVAEYTTDREKLREAIEQLESAGEEGTLLYDGLAKALREFPPGARRRAIVIFTDGVDEGSQVGYEALRRAALRGHTSLYCVLPRLPQPGDTPRSESKANEEWVLIFDLSGTPRGEVRHFRAAGKELLEVLGPEAKAWLLEYRERLRILKSTTIGRPRVRRVLNRREAKQALKELGSPPPALLRTYPVPQRRIANLIVFTDKERTGLLKINQQISIRNAAIMVPTAVSPGKRRALLRMLVYNPKGLRRAVEKKLEENQARMRALAEETGGQHIEVAGSEELEKAYERVAHEIQHSYTLGYYTRARSRRRLRVEARNPQLSVRAPTAVVPQ